MHTTVIHEVLDSDGSGGTGDVRIHHNGDYSGESILQVVGPRLITEAKLPEPATRLLCAAPVMVKAIRSLLRAMELSKGGLHVSAHEAESAWVEAKATALEAIEGLP